MQSANIRSRGRITIPKKIQQALELQEGDTIGFQIDGDRLMVYRVHPRKDGYLHGAAHTLSEWNSPEDEEAWVSL